MNQRIRYVDYLHVWLADGLRNHCECEECRKARPSDYYLMIMNEIDERLNEAGLSTRIVFIAYFDTMFPPEYVKIHMQYVYQNLKKEDVAKAYDVNPEKIEIIAYDVVNSIKITFPRKNISGSLKDNDIYGCQQHMPLANIEM